MEQTQETSIHTSSGVRTRHPPLKRLQSYVLDSTASWLDLLVAYVSYNSQILVARVLLIRIIKQRMNARSIQAEYVYSTKTLFNTFTLFLPCIMLK